MITVKNYFKLEKAKPYTRTRLGKLEQVKGYPDRPKAVKEYQSGMYGSKIGGYSTIQKYLREGKIDDWNKIEREDIQKYIDMIDSSFEPNDTDLVLYRGGRHSKERYGNFNVGDIITEKGYTSTSKDRKVAERFSKKLNADETPIVVTIKVPKGNPIIKVSDITGEDVGLGRPEKEYLLPRNQKYKIISKNSSEITLVAVFSDIKLGEPFTFTDVQRAEARRVADEIRKQLEREKLENPQPEPEESESVELPEEEYLPDVEYRGIKQQSKGPIIEGPTIVFRIGKGGENLLGRNAGNLNSIISHFDRLVGDIAGQEMVDKMWANRDLSAYVIEFSKPPDSNWKPLNQGKTTEYIPERTTILDPQVTGNNAHMSYSFGKDLKSQKHILTISGKEISNRLLKDYGRNNPWELPHSVMWNTITKLFNEKLNPLEKSAKNIEGQTINELEVDGYKVWTGLPRRKRPIWLGSLKTPKQAKEEKQFEDEVMRVTDTIWDYIGDNVHYVILEKGRKYNPGLVGVMVNVKGKKGIYRALRWKSPEEAQRMVREGTGSIYTPTQYEYSKKESEQETVKVEPKPMDFKTAKELGSKMMPKLNDKELLAASHYMADSSAAQEIINENLGLSDEELYKKDPEFRDLDSAIGRGRFPEDTILFRHQFHKADEIWNSVQIGGSLDTPNYVSTTSDWKYVLEMVKDISTNKIMGIAYEIVAKKNSNGLPMMVSWDNKKEKAYFNKDEEWFADEKEFLLPRKSSFKVLEKREENGVRIIKLEYGGEQNIEKSLGEGFSTVFIPTTIKNFKKMTEKKTLEKSKQVQVKPYQRKGKYVIGYHRLDPREKEEITNETSNIKTGQPITFNFYHNPEKAPKVGTTFAQDIEPIGKYINFHKPEWGKVDKFEYGKVTFNNPLVLEWKTSGHGGWKTDLSSMYGGKRGKALTQAIIKNGHDGIVTVDSTKNLMQEIVSLTHSEQKSYGQTRMTTEQAATEIVRAGAEKGVTQVSRVSGHIGDKVITNDGMFGTLERVSGNKSVTIKLNTPDSMGRTTIDVPFYYFKFVKPVTPGG